MDGCRFAILVRSIAGTRRPLVGSGLAVIAGWLGVGGSDARKKRRKRRKNKEKPRLNQFGCIDVGGKCFGKDANCCSGICEGSGKTSRCVAHNELGCTADEDSCAEFMPCGATGGCHRTTGKAGFCASVGLCDCTPCQKDTDCEADFGPGAACIICTGDCVGVNGSQGTACIAAAD